MYIGGALILTATIVANVWAATKDFNAAGAAFAACVLALHLSNNGP